MVLELLEISNSVKVLKNKIKIAWCEKKKKLRAFPVDVEGNVIKDYGAIPFPRNALRTEGLIYEISIGIFKSKDKNGFTRRGKITPVE